MRKLIVILLLMSLLLGTTACSSGKETSQFSENILVSINHGAAGFGTIWDTIDAEIYICKDKTVKVVVHYPEELEIASFTITDEEYKTLSQLASPVEILSLIVIDDPNVCDGSSSHIRLYGPDDEVLIDKGGYMPQGDRFWEIYNGIKEVLKPYNITGYVEEYREYRENLETGNIPETTE